jgi:hypothetical protein
MARIKIVTGYCPIENHPRSAAEYGKLGEHFLRLRKDVPVHPSYSTVADCWLSNHLKTLPYKVTHSTADNPAKNSLDYLCVQHEKFAWLVMAGVLDHTPDVFVWMDYGIFHVPGVTVPVINMFLAKLLASPPTEIIIPGCTPLPEVIDDAHPCWRRSGGVMVVPKSKLMALFHAVRSNVSTHIALTKNLSWEVNTLARIEKSGTLPIRWYYGNHDQTLFTGY